MDYTLYLRQGSKFRFIIKDLNNLNSFNYDVARRRKHDQLVANSAYDERDRF